ncbi:PulJ/GspJ family protein [Neorhodopirellula pilleata]|uniref:Uncharacterized protein n=1 Tax=Neorhodopirellula pilleata TaxID=2714738 RepID=A0A5C6AUY2_9BACT|nr:hypothetical protein [Neorhodopirellula pilleata]TWU03241.1 hypothetical protein Pla100_01590 [Neorhodopirellula pilleata]
MKTIRPGITLLELVVSMSAAMMLMIGMSMSLGVVLRSAETIESVDRSDEVILRDWIDGDVRYATRIESPGVNQWNLQRPDTSGVDQSIGYRVEDRSLKRRVGNGSWATIAPDVQSLTMQRVPFSAELDISGLDGLLGSENEYAETDGSPVSACPEIVGVRTAMAEDDDQLTIDVPPSVADGDWLIVAGGSRGNQSLQLAGGWSTRVDDSQWTFSGNVRLKVWSRPFDPSIGSTVTLTCSSDTLINAAVLVIRRADLYDPFAAVMSDSTIYLSGSTRADPGYRDSTQSNELNLQIVAVNTPGNGSPSMGMSGYADVASVTNSGDRDWSLYLATRQGSLMPTNTSVQADIPFLSAYVLASFRIRP